MRFDNNSIEPVIQNGYILDKLVNIETALIWYGKPCKYVCDCAFVSDIKLIIQLIRLRIKPKQY